MPKLLFFMEKRLAEFDRRGQHDKADRLKKIIREYKAMLDKEQVSLSSL